VKQLGIIDTELARNVQWMGLYQEVQSYVFALPAFFDKNLRKSKSFFLHNEINKMLHLFNLHN
jgi:hypothetical protein